MQAAKARVALGPIHLQDVRKLPHKCRSTASGSRQFRCVPRAAGPQSVAYGPSSTGDDLTATLDNFLGSFSPSVSPPTPDTQDAPLPPLPGQPQYSTPKGPEMPEAPVVPDSPPMPSTPTVPEMPSSPDVLQAVDSVVAPPSLEPSITSTPLSDASDAAATAGDAASSFLSGLGDTAPSPVSDAAASTPPVPLSSLPELPGVGLPPLPELPSVDFSLPSGVTPLQSAQDAVWCVASNALRTPQTWLRRAQESFTAATLDVTDAVTRTVTQTQESVQASISASTSAVTESVDAGVGSVRSGAAGGVGAATSGVSGLLQKAGAVAGGVTDSVGASVNAATAGLQGSAAAAVAQVNDALGQAAETLPLPLREAVGGVAGGVGRTLQVVVTNPWAGGATLLGGGWLAFRYYVDTYGGFAGFVEPEMCLAMLEGGEGIPETILVDVRGTNQQDEGIPNLKRGARGKGYSVPMDPELLGPCVAEQCGNIRELQLEVAAAYVLGLQPVNSLSSVVIMGADDKAAKAVARAVTAQGLRQVYVLEGGYQGWKDVDLDTKRGTYVVSAVDRAADRTEELAEAAGAIADELATPRSGLPAVLAGGFALAAAWDVHTTLQAAGILGLELTVVLKLLSYSSPRELLEDVEARVSGLASKVGGAAASARSTVAARSGGGGGGKERGAPAAAITAGVSAPPTPSAEVIAEEVPTSKPRESAAVKEVAPVAAEEGDGEAEKPKKTAKKAPKKVAAEGNGDVEAPKKGPKKAPKKEPKKMESVVAEGDGEVDKPKPRRKRKTAAKPKAPAVAAKATAERPTEAVDAEVAREQ